ncbi:MAG: hypothetical protein ACFNJR_01165, partial [Segatella oulorum]|uniref:hypothetical protein n=1 Tax=Segatella oulorum TaxID=28136 RepID=UPI00360DBC9E
CIAGCFFFLSERCRQPLATRRERLHLSERDTLLLHFVLELAEKTIEKAMSLLLYFVPKTFDMQANGTEKHRFLMFFFLI